MHTSENDISILIDAMNFVIIFDPFLISKYQGRSFKADTMLPNIDPIFIIIPLNDGFIYDSFHN